MFAARGSVFDPDDLLSAPRGRDVSVVVIGAFARVIHGTGEGTDELDVTNERRSPSKSSSGF